MKTYTFYVNTAPAGDIVSRTLELPAEWTLEDLSDAIQDAFGLDGQADFSFFMSGVPWDEASEYTHLDELWGDDELWEDDEIDDEIDDEAFLLDDEPDVELDDEAQLESLPAAQDVRNLFAQLKADPKLRGELAAQLADEFNLPAFILDAVISNADSLMGQLADAEIDKLMAGFDPEADLDEPLGDTREARLADLGLAPGRSFLYLYDFDDERHFEVHLEEVQESDLPEDRFPQVLESVGELPLSEE
ncbi:MAG: Plasmid pRiA4b ORF-3-like protein [Chloroflexi bacterium ADurb.Bin325]|nr:MAG: Plasmid pRiA4b ORF-3-like protein [Chloroflexi bacterium ADurb.Bin325]